jgi:ketosteroid isomerase-like protein
MDNEDIAIVRKLQAEWSDAFEKRDIDRLVALYAPNTAFWGSTNELHKSAAGVRSYFEGLPPSYKRSRYDHPYVIRLAENVLSASVNVTFVKEMDGQDVSLPYRMTHILVRNDTGWKIATHHASPQV